MEHDWDLQAVVRGFCTGEDMENAMHNPSTSLFAPLRFDQDELLAFPEIYETSEADYFEGLCMPFYPMSENLITSTTSISVPQEGGKHPRKVKRLEEEKALLCDPVGAVKMKRRKNQNKRVVQEVGKDGLSSDTWAWRKYGQKPIKGSPYPRSYYRCSSSKGCLARKQVERSSSDPSTFIITYTGEHSHAQPTRRNSLAGCTRNKPSIPKGLKASEPNMGKTEDESSSNTGAIPCPATTFVASTEEGFAKNVSIKDEPQEQVMEDCENNEVTMPDIVFSDELFPSIEDLEGLLLDQFTVPCSLMDHQQFQAVDTH